MSYPWYADNSVAGLMRRVFEAGRLLNGGITQEGLDAVRLIYDEQRKFVASFSGVRYPDVPGGEGSSPEEALRGLLQNCVDKAVAERNDYALASSRSARLVDDISLLRGP